VGKGFWTDNNRPNWQHPTIFALGKKRNDRGGGRGSDGGGGGTGADEEYFPETKEGKGFLDHQTQRM